LGGGGRETDYKINSIQFYQIKPLNYIFMKMVNPRRNFLKQSTLILGGLLISPSIFASKDSKISSAALNKKTGKNYCFDGKISREVLENYLSRSFHMLQLTGSQQLDEDIRMIKNVGAKHIGRVAAIWWSADTKVDMDEHFGEAKILADRLLKIDPEFMLQACIFETVGKGINTIPVPAWVFEEFGITPGERNFLFNSMIYDNGYEGHGHGCMAPDMSKTETQMWFYYCGRRYIDSGYENIHVGMISIMDHQDPNHKHWFNTLTRLRRYAAKTARRHMVLFDSQLQGIVEDGKLLLDYHNMVLRPKDVIGKPEECILEIGYGDSIWGRSKGGISPSGWSCEHLPFQAEIDNGFSPGKAHQNIGFPYAWGRCEIDWFANQPEEYRNKWLRYAWTWIRENDANGYLQMQGRKVLSEPIDGKYWYYANTRSNACPDGFNQEETIKAIWEGR
jgi:hypothetical protein